MKIAIMQPYFFPYLGYFTLISQTEKFILFDTVQFIRHGWIERNRILKQDEGWLYIQVPLKKPNGRETIIKDILIDNSTNWQKRILSQLIPYKKIAPYYRAVVNLMNDLFSNEFNDIINLDKISLELVCNYIGITHDFYMLSTIDLPIENANSPDEWALNICKALGNVSEYWNLPGGINFFDRDKYINSGLKLKFAKSNLTYYDQKRNVFEPGLSILDVMMFNAPSEIKLMIDDFELI